MIEPTNHTLVITIPGGKTAHVTVVYLHSKAGRWQMQSAEMHITCLEWLEAYWHPAVYRAGTVSYKGKFIPHTYEKAEPQGWLFKGTFERDK